MKCKHGMTTEHCSICTPYKQTSYEPYTLTFDTKDGDRVRMRKFRKKTTYKSPVETGIETAVRQSYWGYN